MPTLFDRMLNKRLEVDKASGGIGGYVRVRIKWLWVALAGTWLYLFVKGVV